MEKAFSNIGGKLKGLAKFCFVFGCIASIVSGVILIITSRHYYYSSQQ